MAKALRGAPFALGLTGPPVPIALNVIGIAIKLLEIAGKQGITFPMLSGILGVDPPNITQIIKREGLNLLTLSYENRKELQVSNVIQIIGRPPKFVPKSTIRAVVKIVWTVRAQDIYNQLRDVAEAIQIGDLHVAQDLVGVSEDLALVNLEAALAFAKKLKVERDEAIKTKAQIWCIQEALLGKVSGWQSSI